MFNSSIGVLSNWANIDLQIKLIMFPSPKEMVLATTFYHLNPMARNALSKLKQRHLVETHHFSFPEVSSPSPKVQKISFTFTVCSTLERPRAFSTFLVRSINTAAWTQ